MVRIHKQRKLDMMKTYDTQGIRMLSLALRLLAIVALLALSGCPKDECSKNSDCEATELCVSGACESAVVNNQNNANNQNNSNNQNNQEDMGTCSCPGTQQCDPNGACVDCLTDLDCPTNSVCVDDGTCECESGTHDCNGDCLPNDDIATCGDRCDPCETPTNGVATCDGTTCGVSCDQGFVYCETCTEPCGECDIAGSDCDAANPVCADGTCSTCTMDAECAGFAGMTICEEGSCVECNVANEAICGGTACDPATNMCTATAIGSLTVCQSCVSDTECGTGLRCVPMNFQGTLRPTGYCLQPADNGCGFPYGTVISGRVSLSGVGGNYCGIREDYTTCEAVLSYGSSCAQAGDCTNTGLADAVCEPIEFDVAACSYQCDNNSPDQCPSEFFGCLDGRCGGY